MRGLKGGVCVWLFFAFMRGTLAPERKGHVSTASSSFHYSEEEDLIWFCTILMLIGLHFLLSKGFRGLFLLSQLTAQTKTVLFFGVFL